MTQSGTQLSFIKAFYGTFILLLVVLWLHLSFQLWFGSMGFPVLKRLQKDVQHTQAENQWLQERNQLLTAEILELKHGVDAVEERARHELGMIKEYETFVWIVSADE
jgi:cell division protein FtsB